jgi:flagellar export protein FliJ
MMKSRDALMRLKRFQVDEKRRRLSQIETMIAEFKRMAGELDREIAAEETRAGITDRAHFAYPTYARAAIQRRDNLLQSAQDLEGQREDARTELEEAFEDLKKFEILDDRESIKEKAMEAVREQAELDRVAAGMRLARA